jgi:hypothetical protein
LVKVGEKEKHDGKRSGPSGIVLVVRAKVRVYG